MGLLSQFSKAKVSKSNLVSLNKSFSDFHLDSRRNVGNPGPVRIEKFTQFIYLKWNSNLHPSRLQSDAVPMRHRSLINKSKFFVHLFSLARDNRLINKANIFDLVNFRCHEN